MYAKYSHNQSVISKRFFLEIAVTCGLILLTGIPRLLDLNSFVTTDEKLWLTRSGNFYYALKHQDFEATFQKSHPGVTTMWAGLIGFMEVYPDYQDSYGGQARPIGLGVLAKRDFTLPLQILVAGRRTMVIFHMLTLGFSFLFASRLFGMKPALVGFLLIAFDPFHIALSRILHLDGLLADLMLLSVLAFLMFLNNHKMGTLFVSAVAAGLAWLTKSPGLFLVPLITLLALLDQMRMINKQNKPVRQKAILQIIKTLTIWGMVGTLMAFILWPSTWVNPLGSLVRVLTDAIGYAKSGHATAVFFNGHLHTGGDIPDLDFYPINFLWRTTPVILLGLIATIVLFIQRWHVLLPNSKFLSKRQTSEENKSTDIDPKIWMVAVLIFFALGFGVLMTLGLKKFDRYIMPSIVLLDLASGVSLVWLIDWATQCLREKWRFALTGAILLGFVIVQASLAWTAFPYFFSYYNPLLGGSQRAVEVMQIGWGEGLDQAANYINNKSNSDQLRVIAWYGDGPFSYFSKSQVSPLDVDHPWSTADWDQFNKSDYAVVYIHEWQRNLPAEVLDRLRNLIPEYSVWIDGLEYVRIYKIQ